MSANPRIMRRTERRRFCRVMRNGVQACPVADLPRALVGVVGCCWAGMADIGEIAEAVGCSRHLVRWIVECQDYTVRRWLRDGLPLGSVAVLAEAVYCPGCRSEVTVIPCVACEARHARSE